MEKGISNDPRKEGLKRRGLWVIIVLSFIILFLTIWQYPSYLRAPFSKYGQERGLWKSPIQQEAEKILALKTKDTDNDGLSDFDEIYIYNTSPYLADSDSDGFSDKEEIESGNDPNCPAGKICPKIEEASLSGAPLPEETVGVLPGYSGLLSGNASVAEIREALRQGGMSEEILNKLDDASLLELYNETLRETGTAGAAGVNANTNINANVNINTNNFNFDNLTADELRRFLIQAGAEQSLLDGVDDETLLRIFKESFR
jgi:hypothetical protein